MFNKLTLQKLNPIKIISYEIYNHNLDKMITPNIGIIKQHVYAPTIILEYFPKIFLKTATISKHKHVTKTKRIKDPTITFRGSKCVAPITNMNKGNNAYKIEP